MSKIVQFDKDVELFIYFWCIIRVQLRFTGSALKEYTSPALLHPLGKPKKGTYVAAKYHTWYTDFRRKKSHSSKGEQQIECGLILQMLWNKK